MEDLKGSFFQLSVLDSVASKFHSHVYGNLHEEQGDIRTNSGSAQDRMGRMGLSLLDVFRSDDRGRRAGRQIRGQAETGRRDRQDKT